MTIKAEAILETLAKLRESIPYELRWQPPQRETMPIDSIEDFELATVAASIEQLAAELRDALDREHERVLANALRVYYAAEELARDPANAHLIPHVEAMRQAFERDYGKPIPPRT
jgi:hypothetical protein